MNSLGKSCKWPSIDSLPSTPGLLFSESEHTEDEADVFNSEGEGAAIPILRLAFTGHRNPAHRRSEGEEGDRRPRKATYPASVFKPGATTITGDVAFAQKCADLQRYVRPLLELLTGLKTGRFERGLTSFQQSVAMDRLQRILGILQKPDMGEKYLRTLLQVEMMLKLWFPQVARQLSCSSTKKTPSLPPRWHKNQLHIPVKKRKLSWLDSDFPSSDSSDCQQDTTSRLSGASTDWKGLRDGNVVLEGDSWTSGHELRDNTLDRPSYFYSKGGKENCKRLAISPPSFCGSTATQDSSVSSSCTTPVADSPQLPLLDACQRGAKA